MTISLGDITFGIGPDTARLRSSINDIVSFGSAVEQAAAKVAAGANAATTSLMNQESAAISALQKVQRFQDEVARSGANTKVSSGLNQISTQALSRLTQEMTSGKLSTLDYQRAMLQFNSSMSNGNRILGDFNAAQRLIKETDLRETLRKLADAGILVAGPLSGIATRLTTLSSLAGHFSAEWVAGIASVSGAAYGFLKFSEAAIDVGKEMEKVQLSLAAVSGSSIIAETQMKSLSDLSDRSGQSFSTLAYQYGQVAAAAKGTSLEGERTTKVFDAIVMAESKIGRSSAEVNDSLSALQQMIGKGTLTASDFSRRLGKDLPGALSVLAESMGVTELKAKDMLDKQQVGISVLSKFADALNKRYGIDEATKINTITAAEGRLDDARKTAVDSLDKIVNVSGRYKDFLNLLAGGILSLSSNMKEFVAQVLRVGVALASVFAVPLITSGILTMVSAITKLASAVWALDAAAAANGFRSFAKLFVTAAVAAAAYYGSQKMFDDMLEKSGKSFTQALPPVEAYIAAQQKLASSDRGPTKDYLKDQADQLDKLTKKRQELADQAFGPVAEVMAAKSLGATEAELDKIANNKGIPTLARQLTDTDKEINQVKKNIEDLNKILGQQTKKEDNPKPDPTADLTTKQGIAIKKAEDQVKELNQTYANLNLAPAAKAFADLDVSIYKSVETFRNSLTGTELSTKTVTDLTDKYAASLRKVKETELAMSHQTSYFQTMEGLFSRGIDSGLNNFVDVVVNGKNALLALKDVAKMVLQDLLKTMLMLSAINPLKNALFGTNYQTLGGSAGVGGMVGNLFGGGADPGSSANPLEGLTAEDYGAGFARGGVMTSGGPKPLRRYSAGGVARGSQFAEFGEGSNPEAYVPLPDGRSIPVTMEGASGGPAIHIHEAQGVKASVSYGSHNGDDGIHVTMKKVSMGAVMEDIASGGALSKMMEKQYGLNRTRGMGG